MSHKKTASTNAHSQSHLAQQKNIQKLYMHRGEGNYNDNNLSTYVPKHEHVGGIDSKF